ncbi:MAG: GspH/FimT family pseudopilin [Kiritimatiellia bacterium]
MVAGGQDRTRLPVLGGVTRMGHSYRMAFTLIELLVVMTIIALLTTAGVAAYYGIGKGTRVRSALRNFQSTLSLARQRAVLKSQPMTIVIDADKGCYYVTNRVEKYKIGETVYLPYGVRFYDPNSGKKEITFRPNGAAEGIQVVSVAIGALTGNPKESWEMRVYPLSGLMKATEVTGKY